MQAVALLADGGGKAFAVGGGEVFLQEFGAGGDGGERAFQFVGEGFDVAGDVGAVFEFAPHGADGVGEAVEFGGEMKARSLLFAGMGGGVAPHAVDAVAYPESEQGNEGKAGKEIEEGGAAQLGLCVFLVGEDVGTGLAEADDAKELAIDGTDGRCDVHGAVGAAGAVFASQGAEDVVPLAVVAAGFVGIGVVEDDAVRIGDDELLVVGGFVVMVNAGVLRGVELGAELFAPLRVVDVAAGKGGGESGGEGLGVVGKGVFQYLAHAGTDLLLKVADEKDAAKA